MFQRIWQWLKQLWRRWVARQPPPAPTRQPPSDAESESVFMQLLQEVASGSTRGEIQGFLIIQQGKKHVTEADLVAWLRRASSSWLTSPAQHQELGRRMGRLGDIYKGELAEVARDISRQLVVENKPSVQYPSNHRSTTPTNQPSVSSNPKSTTPTNQPSVTQPPTINPEAATLYNQGVDLYNAGNVLGALALFERAVAIDPNYVNAWNGLGIALNDVQRYEEAIAAYNRTIELNSDFYPAYNNRGLVRCDLESYDEGIADFTKAITLNSGFYEAYYNRAFTLLNLGHYKKAIDDYTKVIAINSSFDEAYNYRGLAKYNLRLYKEAIDDYTKAIAINSSSYGAYNNRGLAFADLGAYKAAIEDYTEAIAFNDKFYEVYNNRGNALKNLGHYDSAIQDYNQAIALNPNYYYPYNNRGNALSELGRYLEAIADYTKGIDLNAQYYEAYNNRGLVKYKLAQYQEAIKDYDCAIKIKPDYWRPWDFRGLAILSLEGYDAAIKNWRDGIIELEKYSPVDFRGCGELYLRIGSEQFLHGNQQENPFPDWREAKASYYKSLENLDQTQVRERYLEVLREYIKVCRALGDNKQDIDELVRQGTDILDRLIKDCKVEADKPRLDRKFASFIQYRVDSLVAEKNILAAFNLAEERKNTSLRLLHDRYSNSPSQPSDFNSLLTHPGAAAIYWHVSDAAITTFILRFSQPPDIFPTSTSSTDAYQQMLKFETWLKEWKKDYQSYCETLKTEGTAKKSEALIFKQNLGDLPSPENHPWRAKMPERLNQLAEILHIRQILTAVGNNITQIILIPHRDLHLLPLESLFYQTLEANGNLPAITRLPSAQIGINLQPLQLTTEKQLLNVFGSADELWFPEMEFALIAQLYHPHLTSIPSDSATKQQITAAISTGTNCFHFTGHGYHNLDSPTESALELTNQERLTLQEIFQLNFQGYHLVSLSACETGITSKQGIIDEYIGLVSGFLAGGVARVVSTLWRVDEFSAALMMIKFHQLFKDGIPPAEALQQAQHWLRTITYGELAQWYRHRAAELQSPYLVSKQKLESLARNIENSARINSDQPPFAHPCFWSGFTITGKINNA